MQYLYHYTCIEWLKPILDTGYLTLTESNVKDFSKTKFDYEAYNRGELELFKPVVWMTTNDEPDIEGLGLISKYDKTEIKITIKKQIYFKKWLKWSKEQNINKDWARCTAKGRDAGSWWISEHKVYLADAVVKIENRYTGEIYFENEKFKCVKMFF